MFRRIPLYPLLLAAYPVLALGAHNISQITPRDMLRPLLLSLLLGAALLGLAFLLLRDWHRAALVSSLALLLFFSYGQVYALSKGINLAGVPVFRHRTLLPLWILVLGGGTWWLGWKLQRPGTATVWLNSVAALLLVFPTLTLASSMAANAAAASKANRSVLQTSGTGTARPDIYYIILDGYARHDALKQETGLDNSEFISALRQRGFYVADCSQSNYAHTEVSLPSSLNYDYLDHLGVERTTDLPALIKHGAARTFLEERGYKTVAFPSGFAWGEWRDADSFPLPPYQAAMPTSFEDLILETSILRAPIDLGQLSFITAQGRERYRQRVLSALENLERVPADPAPTFTFGHVVIPHPPYLFGPNGEAVSYQPVGITTQLEIQGYAGQATFVSREILKVIDAILAGSDTPPVIVIQGDHGAPVELGEIPQRMQILNAYYLPGAGSALYPSITPVNTFRVIFNAYFGADLPLLPDSSFFSTYSKMLDLSPVPGSCPQAP